MTREHDFLKFGGNNHFHMDYKTGIDYMAVRPVCEFFGANYYLEVIKLQEHDLVGEEIRKFPIVWKNTLHTIPEFFIPVMYVIGWIPMLDVPSKKITAYYKNYKSNEIE